jgi:hypothetical protein
MASICELSYASTRDKKPKVLSGFNAAGTEAPFSSVMGKQTLPVL